jgi:hypothetical protein
MEAQMIDKKRISDESKGTDYVKNIMENQSSSNKTNMTVQYDIEQDIEEEFFNNRLKGR